MISKLDILAILLLLLPISVIGQDGIPQLSDKAEISLLTCDPGNELYSAFGHSAIWVSDPAKRINRVYNYGTFDFDEPGFIWKFTRGKLNYKLSVTPWNYFVASYEYAGRSVYKNQINLRPEEKQHLFHLLEVNYLPENQYYLYDFFYDNCATRIRDMLDRAVSEITWADSAKELNSSFRDLTDIYLVVSPWADYGIDLGLGLPADRIANRWQSMFLPDYLQSEMLAATFSDRQGNLLSPKEALYLAPSNGDDLPFQLPILLGWLLFAFVAIMTYYGFRKQKALVGLDMSLLLIAGLLGCFILFLWFGTDHQATAANMNLMWANALLFPLMILSRFTKANKAVSYGLFFCAAVSAITVIAWFFWPQGLHTANLPIALAIGIRSFVAAKNVQLRSQ